MSSVIFEYFLQEVDGASRLALSEMRCGIFTSDDMGQMIGVDPIDLDDSDMHYLDDEQLSALDRFLGLSLINLGAEYRLCSWRPDGDLKYRLHATREYILMIANIKPLSVFLSFIPSHAEFDESPEQLFDPLVSSGLLIKSDYCEPLKTSSGQIKGMRVVIYALRSESWRIDAYILIRFAARKDRWSELLSHLEGRLLGYSDYENDIYFSKKS